MAEIQSISTSLSGEYFVAAELLRRGFTVGITMGNAKGIDILAEKDGKQEEAKPLVKQYSSRGIMNRASLNSEQFKGRWDKIK